MNAGRACLLGLLALVTSAATAKDTLTLRVSDAIAEPGGIAAVVVRTYASRPVGQGQICIGARSGRKAVTRKAPFVELIGSQVFSKKGDSVSVADIEDSADGQSIIIEFVSDSASINKKDGPLAVLFFRVGDDVGPNDSFDLDLDLERTALLDPKGNPIQLEARAGELEMRRVGSPFLAAAEDDKIEPGETAEIGLETFEPVPMASGQIAVRFDPELASGKVRVKMRKQHGKRRFKADRSEPGLVFVTFSSKDASFNSVPGELLSVAFKTPGSTRVGTRSRVWLDPALTFFVDAEDDVLPYSFEDGELEFEAD